MAQKIGEIFVDIGVKTDKFKKGIKETKVQTKQAAKNISTSASEIGKSFAGAAVGALGAAFAVSKLVSIVKESITLANKQIEAENNLATALENTSNEAGVTIEQLKELASGIQDITTVGDEASLEIMQMGLSMGISSDQIGEATKETIGLSKAFKIDLKASIKAVALAREGDFNMLQRYIPALKTATTVAEKQAIATKAMADGFKIAVAETKTFAGRMKQLENTFGDLQERVGKEVIPALQDLGDGFFGTGKDAEIFARNIGKVINLMIRFTKVLFTTAQITSRANPITMLREAASDLIQGKNPIEETRKLIEQLKKETQGIATTISNFGNNTEYVTSKMGASRKRLSNTFKESSESDKKGAEDLTKVWKDQLDQIKGIFDKFSEDVKNKQAKFVEDLKAGILGTLGTLASFGSQLSALVGQQAQNRISILEAETERKIEILEEERQRALDVAGVEEESAAEKEEEDLLKLEDQLNRTVRSRDKKRVKEQIKIKKDAIVRNKINEDFAKKQASIEEAAEEKSKKIQREAAIRQKQLEIFSTLVSIPGGALAAYRTAEKLPAPAAQIVGGILAAAFVALGFARLRVIQQTPLPMQAGGLVRPPGITAEIGEGRDAELVTPLNQKIFDMQGQGIINAIEARQTIEGTDEAEIEEIDEAEGGTSGGDVYLDGALVGEWISRGSEDGTIRISKRTLTT